MKIIILILLIAITGCAPKTITSVRNLDNSKKYIFTTNQNYQPVYRKILEQTRKCHQQGMITAQQVVNGDLFTDIKQGTVSVELHDVFGVSYFQVIDIKGIDDSSTEVTAIFTIANYPKYGEVIKKWVDDNYAECI